MSQEERKLLQLMDEHILNASPEELAKLQQTDISTQLDGVWLPKQDVTTNKLFSK